MAAKMVCHYFRIISWCLNLFLLHLFDGLKTTQTANISVSFNPSNITTSPNLLIRICTYFRHCPKIFFLSPYNHIISEACWSTFLLQFCSKIAVSFLQALFRKLSKKMKKIFSIKWVRPRGESNPGLWVDRQVSKPLHYEELIN